MYIGDNSEIALGTNRTEARTLDAVTAPLEFELSFEDGFHEAREWLELERLCQESRKKHKAA